uniref:Uncharacterized protein n=1 Tax=Oryza barthii TaxID=65489 RepID=A0A0D3FWV0_9ORYZ
MDAHLPRPLTLRCAPPLVPGHPGGDRRGEAGEEVRRPTTWRRRRRSVGLGVVVLAAASRCPLFSFSAHHDARGDACLHTAELLSAAKSAASNQKNHVQRAGGVSVINRVWQAKSPTQTYPANQEA